MRFNRGGVGECCSKFMNSRGDGGLSCQRIKELVDGHVCQIANTGWLNVFA